MVKEFQGKYRFLSNFYEVPANYKGIVYNNNEAAFQAQKCPGRENEFTSLSPDAAKRLGRKVPLRKDWEQIKECVMYEICSAKFTQNPALMWQLLQTEGDLEEGNYWHDTVWGIDLRTGFGENKLGKILMYIREENHPYVMEAHRLL